MQQGYMHMKKVDFLSLILMTAMLLIGCDDNNSVSPKNKPPEITPSTSIPDIIADIGSGDRIYEDTDINISGEYLLNIPSTVCDGFCLSATEISEITEGDLTFVNTYEPYGNNLCVGQTNEIVGEGYSIPVVGFPSETDSLSNYFDCNFSSGDSPIQLSGTLVYTTVINYCSLIEQPSARLHLDIESVERLELLVECQ
jgi:hypothetical protein